MCGIIGYVGSRQAKEVVIKGLKRMEYRGYDSAGIATLNGGLHVSKTEGKVNNLKKLVDNNHEGFIGICLLYTSDAADE